MSNTKLILDRLVVELKQKESVVAFVLIGSQARDEVYKANDFSDIEAIIVVKDEDFVEFESGLDSLVRQLGNVLFSFKHQIGFVATFDDLFRLELPVVKQSEIKSTFSRPKAQTVKILIDKTDGKLEEVLNNRPETTNYEELFKDKAINFWYWQIIAVQYFKKGELYNSRVVLNIHTSALIKLLELLNEPTVLDLETNKRIEQFLSKEQLDLLRKTSPSYNPDQIKQSLFDVMEIFPKIFLEVKSKYGYEFDETLEEKLKPKLLEFLKD